MQFNKSTKIDEKLKFASRYQDERNGLCLHLALPTSGMTNILIKTVFLKVGHNMHIFIYKLQLDF
jgi:hypothetical protein